MSDLTPTWRPPEEWQDWGEKVHQWLRVARDRLDAVMEDERVPLDTQKVAIQVARTAISVDAVMMLLTGLADAVTDLRDIVGQLIAKAQLDETERAEMQERLSQLEYATVAEAQAERIREQLVGDLADMMAGRLRGEDGS